MSGTLSERLRQHVAPLVDRIASCAYLTQLVEGTLPREKFLYFSVMECGYLPRYARAIATVGARSEDLDLFKLCSGWALGLVHHLETAHVPRAKEAGFTFAEAYATSTRVPGLHEYNLRVMMDAATRESVLFGFASVLRCADDAVVYGGHLRARARSPVADYAAWLDAYDNGPMMRPILRKFDELGASATADEVERMMDHARVMTTFGLRQFESFAADGVDGFLH